MLNGTESMIQEESDEDDSFSGDEGELEMLISKLNQKVMEEKELLRGGQFLVKETKCENVFTPEDFSEEQIMMREAVKEFNEREIIAHKARFEAKDYKLRVDPETGESSKVKKRLVSSWNISVYNLYNRANPYFIFFDFSGDPLQGTAEFGASQVSLFPILPSVTWNFKF